jgi:hypothetical protein
MIDHGVNKLLEWGGLVTFMLLAISILLYMVKTLYQNNKEMGEKFLEAVNNSTRAIDSLKHHLEEIRNDFR